MNSLRWLVTFGLISSLFSMVCEAFTIDGTLDPGYGCPLAVQQIATSYGGSSNGTVLAATGSQLDAAYGLVVQNTLYLFIAGTIQDNGNRVQIFFMTGPGGTNTLVSGQVTNVDVVSNSGVNRSVLSWMGPTNAVANVSGPGPGLTFDPGFAPTYWMDVWGTSTNVLFNFAQLWPGGTNASGTATNGYYLGSNVGTNGTLTGGTNPFLIQATINNSATNGIDFGNNHNGCYTNAEGAPEYPAALTVTNGIEIAIPLAAFNSPTGTIAVGVYITNNTGLQFSNQSLGPFWDGTTMYCLTGPGRSTNTWAPFLNLGTLPGQHYFYVGPEMRVTSIAVTNVPNGSITNKSFGVSYLTENNTNLLYELQRTVAPLTTNSVWTSIGGDQPGTGGIISETDTNSPTTNNVGVLYRVLQLPACAP